MHDGAVLASLCIALWGSTPAAARPVDVRFDNGIEATIYSPEDILSAITTRPGDDALLQVDSSTHYRLVTSVADPAIVNKGDGHFHPMSVPAVVEALRAIHLQNAGLHLDVYVLPYPRREVLDSSAREGMILLSPGVRDVSDYAVHFTVTHEVGHIYQYRWLPDQDGAEWRRYASMRGITDDAVYSNASLHKNRPHEIFAEDFRFLFGGEMSTYSGGIENDALALPSNVPGLQEFMRELSDVRHASRPAAEIVPAPNPFNPSTEIQVQFRDAPVGERAQVRVYDAQGHQVRQLFDGSLGSSSLRLHWDGRQDAGDRASSGVYFARLDYQGDIFSTKLLLVK
jgi:hypothetical protein